MTLDVASTKTPITIVLCTVAPLQLIPLCGVELSNFNSIKSDKSNFTSIKSDKSNLYEHNLHYFGLVGMGDVGVRLYRFSKCILCNSMYMFI